MFNHPAAPSQYSRGDKAHRWYPAAGRQVRSPLGVHRPRNALPLILPVSCSSVSLHGNLTYCAWIRLYLLFFLPPEVNFCLHMPLSICSPLSLYVPLYVYFSVSFYLSQSLSFSCSFVSLPLILYRERAAVCLCVCVFVSVCVCMCVPFSLSLSLSLSLTVSYLPVHTQTTNGITIFSSLLTPINCYTSPTLAQ